MPNHRRITVVRTRATATFPAEFILLAAMNPCPCGYATSRSDRCTCQPAEVGRYLRRISGPLLDRIDLQVEVTAVAWRELRGGRRGPTTSEVREAVVFARARAARRLSPGESDAPRTNAQMGEEEMRRHCGLGPRAEALVRQGVEEHGLTARGYGRLLKVARTIADLEGSEGIGVRHAAEALQYRIPGREGEARR
ncbi:MAG: ATP-binding protein [Gemmatimonadota bacterium]